MLWAKTWGSYIGANRQFVVLGEIHQDILRNQDATDIYAQKAFWSSIISGENQLHELWEKKKIKLRFLRILITNLFEF